MRLTFEPEHLALFEIIKAELYPDQTLYIVGGAVRDLLLGRDLHDLDFAMAENPTDLAKKVARRLQAGFFVLDDERHTARVVNYDQQGRLFPLDFVQFSGSSLDEDLFHRDFTINAMGVAIDNLSQIIDPLAGELDLQCGLLRACSEHALMDDPVRVLRGVRLAVQFNFEYAPVLEAAMQKAAAHLPNTSIERQRDEFFRLLAGPDPAEGLKDCRRFRVFETLLPPLVDLELIPAVPPHHFGLFEHTIQTVAHYHHLVNLLSTGSIDQSEINWSTREVFSQLDQFSKALSAYFSAAVTPGRKKAELAYFGALLHDVGKPLTVKEGVDGHFHYNNHAVVGSELAWQMAKRFHLSNAESDWVEKMVRHHMDLMTLVNLGVLPNQRKVYRYFKESGEVGVAIALLLLADTLATFGETMEHNQWKHTVSIVEILLSAWFNHHDTMINPTPLLNGHDLQQHYGMKPGKRIGILLDHLLEEQASGNINSTDQAHTFVRQHLSKL